MANAKRLQQQSIPPPPSHRALQVFAFDPSLDLDLETARVNRSVVEVPWEENLQPGPVGAWVEVVDVDPASQCIYAPVDLDHPHLLAKRGISPSEGNPQFHQQMAYAVAMKTIVNFEQALGRTVHWSPRVVLPLEKGDKYREEYVPRLRIYPHALREANAYYSPDKKALLFGYFNAQNIDPREGLPGGVVFTCLSHDVIAHEMTHAILDGIHRRMIEPSNEDSLAFHEAFADLVAIFQHFTLPGVLELEIAKTRGDLSTENLLAQLAVQFGRATKHGTALRDFLGQRDPATGRWLRKSPDPTAISRTFEPHSRGAILVAAIFDAFLAIYHAHTQDLLRIASGGTGILPSGALHPDLVKRLADEAGTVAQRLLTICIRALDYLPPADVNFGDYVRAMITSDVDLYPDDRRHYRIALIRALRDYGVYPRDVRTLSEESLVWQRPHPQEQDVLRQLLPTPKALRLMTFARDYVEAASEIPTNLSAEDASERLLEIYTTANPWTDGGEPRDVGQRRLREWQRERQFAQFLHRVIERQCRQVERDERAMESIRNLLGIDPFPRWSCDESDSTDDAPCRRRFEVHAVRPTLRTRPDGRSTYELLILITQQQSQRLPTGDGIGEGFSYRFRSGCTLLIDPVSGQVRYCIAKRAASTGRKQRQEQFLRKSLRGHGVDARAAFGVMQGEERRHASRRVRQEPFRLMHRAGEMEDWS